jgi:hypothetical protein
MFLSRMIGSGPRVSATGGRPRMTEERDLVQLVFAETLARRVLAMQLAAK